MIVIPESSLSTNYNRIIQDFNVVFSMSFPWEAVTAAWRFHGAYLRAVQSLDHRTLWFITMQGQNRLSLRFESSHKPRPSVPAASNLRPVLGRLFTGEVVRLQKLELWLLKFQVTGRIPLGNFQKLIGNYLSRTSGKFVMLFAYRLSFFPWISAEANRGPSKQSKQYFVEISSTTSLRNLSNILQSNTALHHTMCCACYTKWQPTHPQFVRVSRKWHSQHENHWYIDTPKSFVLCTENTKKDPRNFRKMARNFRGVEAGWPRLVAFHHGGFGR